MVPDVVRELLVTEVALDKLGARQISTDDTRQLVRNRHVIVRNPQAGGAAGSRRLLIGTTDSGGVITLVIEATIEPTTWLIVTGWRATTAERRVLHRKP